MTGGARERAASDAAASDAAASDAAAGGGARRSRPRVRACEAARLALALLAAACGGEPPCPAADLSPLARAPSYAVVTSEYQTTAIALLDADGALVTEAWIDSGTTTPRILATLSGDVALPGAPEPGVLTLIDRLGVDVVTRIALPAGEALSQLEASPPPAPGEPAFRSNPQDALALGDGTLLVTRHEPALAESAHPLGGGDDVVRLDAATGALVRRYPLSDLGVDVAGTRVHARPSLLAPAEGGVVVGLARLSLDFMTTGPGAVAVLDPESGEAHAVELAGLSGCGVVRPVPGDPARVAVLCAGAAFGSETARRAGAGLALLRVEASAPAALELVLRAADDAGRPVLTSSLVPLGGTRVFAVAMGSLDGIPDRAFVVDVASGAATPLFESEAFAVGAGAFDAAARLLLVPDAAVGVRRMRVPVDGPPEALSPLDASPCRLLPPRQVAALRP